MPVGLAWLRHGAFEQPADVPSAHLPHPLTDAGREQARAGAEALRAAAAERGWRLDRVVDSSPLLRAWETAQIVAETIGGEVAEVADLTERSLGSAANLTMDEIARVIERDPRFDPLPEGWKRNREFRLPLVGAESLREAGARVAAHVRGRIDALSGDGDTTAIKIVVGHGGSIRHAAAELGMLAADATSTLSMFHGAPVVYVRQDGGWRHVFGSWKQR